MRTRLILALLATIGNLLLDSSLAQAQNALPLHKDLVGDNPNADADITLYRAYIDAWSKNDSVKVRQLVAPTYMGYGPSLSDSISLEQTIKGMHSEPRPVAIQYDFLNSFIIKQGPLKGT